MGGRGESVKMMRLQRRRRKAGAVAQGTRPGSSGFAVYSEVLHMFRWCSANAAVQQVQRNPIDPETGTPGPARRWAGAALGLAILAGGGASVNAQRSGGGAVGEGGGEPSSAVAEASLWWEGMLGSDRVLDGPVDGPVWQVETGPGRRLLQLPIRFQSGSEPREFDRAPIEPSGGRFVGWLLPGGTGAAASAGVTRPTGPTDEQLRDLAGLLDTLNRPDADILNSWSAVTPPPPPPPPLPPPPPPLPRRGVPRCPTKRRG